MKNVVITGPTGVLGSALIKKMIKQGITSYVICHPNSQRNKDIPDHELVKKIECDIKDIKNLPKLINEKCDVFFHFAWIGTQDPKNRLNMHMQHENIGYALDTVDVSSSLGCSVYVGAGSQAEYGRISGIIHPDSVANPISGYGMAKLCAGQMTRAMCKNYGIKHIWARVVSTYGINDSKNTLISVVIHKLLNREKPSLTLGEQQWDYLYSDDAADAFYKMALFGKDGAIYVLGSGKTKRLRDFIEIIRGKIDVNIPLGFGDIPYYKDQAMHLEADITSLSKDTNWIPTTTFEKGIEKLIEFEKNKILKNN